MIENVSIANWQSLRKVDLTLGRFTVIVGASSSGKTAFMRAMRGVASNVRGTGQLTRGRNTAAITVRSNGQKVTLQHSGQAWRYLLVGTDGAEREYAKLNAQVPPEVTAALGFDPVPTSGTSVNFAGQFDPPYLLGDAGSSVARVLGELTNVDRIFNAVREANRRRAAASSALRTRESDLQALHARLYEYRGLSERLGAVERAEVIAAGIEDLSRRADTLDRLINLAQTAEIAVAEAVHLPELPTAEALDLAHQQYRLAVEHLTAWATAQREAEAMQDILPAAVQAEQAATDDLHQVLAELGECPTCGQPVTA